MKLEIIILILVTNGLCKNIDSRNRDYSSTDYGYNYPVAYPPFSDEISTTSLPHLSYGPPMLDLPKPNQTIPSNQADFPDNSYLPPDITLQPPQFDPLPIDDTVVIPLPPTNQYLPSTSSNQYDATIARLKVSNISCMDDPVRGYFRASMTATRVITIPVIDDAIGDCITVTGNVFRLNLEGDRMKKCAVRFCANGVNMCVTIRVPNIKGLKLGDDTLLTLRCRPQERVVSHTKHFKINTKNLVHQARSIPTVATGGSQRNFDTHVSLYRKSSTGRDFTVPVDSGSAVQLGEELLLRTTVKDGDDLLAELTCSVCEEYLSCPPIRMKNNGDVICGRCCDPEDEKTIRITPYEIVTRMFQFPCMNESYGCSELLRPAEVFNHEEECQYRQYVCPIQDSSPCDWSGCKRDLMIHCKEQHAANVRNKNKFTILHDICKTNQKTFLLTAYKALFIIHCKTCVASKKIYHGVRLIGKAKMAPCYMFQLKISKDKDNWTKYFDVAVQGCMALQEDLSLHIDINSVLLFFGDFKDVTFQLTVGFKCMKCTKFMLKQVYQTDDGWLCERCKPVQQMDVESECSSSSSLLPPEASILLSSLESLPILDDVLI